MNALCWGAHLAGGTHHAFYNHGEGFCVFSDIAVSANVVLQKYPNIIRRILILDLDVHQGNGNAVLFQGRPEVFTFSMHCSANYFSEKQNSDLDIELPPNCNDETYIMTLGHWLKQMKLNFAGDFDLVFFQAGVDILEDDRLGQMNISASGIQRRNKLVFDFCRELHLPLIITMGGGYPRQNNWAPIVEAHANVYVQAYRYLSESGR
jgi:acetoin utilization deacetylase AcuC-like enzyme